MIESKKHFVLLEVPLLRDRYMILCAHLKIPTAGYMLEELEE